LMSLYFLYECIDRNNARIEEILVRVS